MNKDLRFQLAINRVPDQPLTDEVSEIEVQQTIDGAATFRVRFAVDICNGDLTLVDDVRLNPGVPDTEVTIMVALKGRQFCLMHGIITERQVSLTEGGPGSWLEISGEDRRVVMDRIDRTRAHSGTADTIVRAIVEAEPYGFKADAVPRPIQYKEEEHTLNQTTTDLDFVTRLAGRSDVRFWLSCSVRQDATGMLQIQEIAHFRPSPDRGQDNARNAAPPFLLAPEDAAELLVNSGNGCSNLSLFEIRSNAEAPNRSGPVQRVHADNAAVHDADVDGATTEPLGEETVDPQDRTRRLVTAGNADEARLRTQAALNDASWSVEARAETSAFALGTIVEPHQVIKVSGAGKLNSGNYFVRSVRHSIDPTDHKMSIELLRNALGS